MCISTSVQVLLATDSWVIHFFWRQNWGTPSASRPAFACWPALESSCIFIYHIFPYFQYWSIKYINFTVPVIQRLFEIGSIQSSSSWLVSLYILYISRECSILVNIIPYWQRDSFYSLRKIQNVIRRWHWCTDKALRYKYLDFKFFYFYS